MSTITGYAGSGAVADGGILSRDKDHRQARLQPVDGAAGGAVHASVHRPGLCVQRLQSADDQADRHHAIGARRLEAHRARLDLLDRDLLPRRLGGGVRPLGRGRRPAPRDVHRGPVLGGGFLVSALGVYVHNLWLVYLGYGVLGGCGLGIGYISPVSTLIKWFPDRPGMATGMAIMGFGGGAFIASPLSVWLMRQVLDADPCRRRRDLPRAGRDLSGLHDGRRGDRARAGAGLEAGGLCRRPLSRAEARSPRTTSTSTRR